MSAFSRGAHLSVTLLALAIACGGSAPTPSVAPAQASVDRLIVRSAVLELSVDADSIEGTAREVERAVTEAGGLVERANVDREAKASLQCRVPAALLEPVIDRVAALGDEKRRSVAAADITEQYSDLEARLRNAVALRERMRQLLDRATSVEEALAIEKELARVQADIEAMQARVDRMKSQVELATLSITIERKRVLGPLGYVGYGVWWAISKLFVIR